MTPSKRAENLPEEYMKRKVDEMELVQTREMLTYANPKGRGMLDQLEEQEFTRNCLVERVRGLREEMGALKNEVGPLENEVNALKTNSEGFLKLRQRFLGN